MKVNAADAGALAELKREAGIGDKLASCHTAKIDGYVIEGHVPGTDIRTLDRQQARGRRPHRPGNAGRLRLEWSSARTLSPMMFY